MAYNLEHGLSPQPLNKPVEMGLRKPTRQDNFYVQNQTSGQAAELKNNYPNVAGIERDIKMKKKEMLAAAKELDFILAAALRDQIKELESLKNQFK